MDLIELPDFGLAHECRRHPGFACPRRAAYAVHVHRSPGPESVRLVRSEPPTVGRGEREVIALGLELSCPVVLDDRKARLRARRVGLEITGTLGVLLRLNRIGLASRGIEEDLRLLEETGMRSSPDLRMTVIEAGRQDEGQQPGR